ncbi:hypothetical protein SALBM135S_02139 [Streptomyces alboniger]
MLARSGRITWCSSSGGNARATRRAWTASRNDNSVRDGRYTADAASSWPGRSRPAGPHNGRGLGAAGPRPDRPDRSAAPQRRSPRRGPDDLTADAGRRGPGVVPGLRAVHSLYEEPLLLHRSGGPAHCPPPRRRLPPWPHRTAKSRPWPRFAGDRAEKGGGQARSGAARRRAGPGRTQLATRPGCGSPPSSRSPSPCTWPHYGPATFHAQSFATSYRADGDHTARTPGAGAFDESTESWARPSGGVSGSGPAERDGISLGMSLRLHHRPRPPAGLDARARADAVARTVVRARDSMVNSGDASGWAGPGGAAGPG